jgi:hypothetical protein
MNLVADTDIDWEILQARFQNIWTTTALRRKWVRLKSSVDEFRNKTHQGLLTLPIHPTLGLFDIKPRDHHSPSRAILVPD